MREDSSEDRTRSYAPLSSNSVVGHYRVLEKIGAGGMGEVYLAEDTTLHRKVALKFLPTHLSQDPASRARFAREAQAAAMLSHPNIVTIHEVSEFNGRPFFAMEHIEGVTIREFARNKELPLDRIVEFVIQACAGLAKAHAVGIVHRDIKPSNILIASDELVKVVDFGLASVHGTERLTKTGSTLGTAGYMSPEQARGEAADARSDLFSLGVVFYELISGRSPFRNESDVATIRNVIEKIPEPLERYKQGVPAELQRIVSRLLEKKPELRYQTADDLASDLRRLTLAAPQVKQKSGRRALLGVTVSVVAVGVLVAGYLFTRDGRPTSARKMLAVLPFDNLSPDPEQEYFSDGLTEELTSSLSQIRSISVVSRSSSMTFKGSKMTIPDIAKALRVRYVVNGSVRKAGNKLRITAQLIDASDDVLIWSKSYDGTLSDIFDMQDSVSSAIVGGIKVRMTSDESERLNHHYFADVRAYEFYLHGKREVDLGTPEAIRRGMDDFNKGLEIVGDNPLLYSGLAWAWWNLVNAGSEQESGISNAIDYAQKALRLDPESAEAHAVLGWVSAGFLGDERQAISHYRNALAIDSSNELALMGAWVSYFIYLGKASTARTISDKYLELYPLDSFAPFRQQADLCLWSGRFLEAIGPLRKNRHMGEKFPIVGFLQAMALANCDSTREAVAVADTTLQTYPNEIVATFCRLLKSALDHDSLSALRELTPEVVRTCRRDAQWSFHVGALLARAGAKEEALDWCENALGRGFINYPLMLKDPSLDCLRSDERFRSLLARMKDEWQNFDA
jgi:serine/threonine protein kinase/tetratricopeptide (TPR) repeat protein